MAEASKIEWTDATWNPITGCTLVSDGCKNCYAANLAATRLKDHPSRKGLARLNADGIAKFTGEVRFNEDWLDQPLRWRRPRMIFVCAHGDLFHESVPDEWIDQVFAIMALAPDHTFQVLTKRPERMRDYMSSEDTYQRILRAADPIRIKRPDLCRVPMSDPRQAAFWPHVWLGTSVENQATAEERVPALMATPAAVRFLSSEPLLSEINLDGIWGYPGSACGDDLDRWPIHWVIIGGESGRGARPMHPDWARSLRDQCQAAGVSFHFKQWGAWQTVYDRDRDDPDWRRCPKAETNKERYLTISGGHGFHGDRVVFVRSVGKAAAGRTLDGRTWDEIPGRTAA